MLLILTMHETYPPVLLAQKAARIRRETGDERWYAPIESERGQVKLGEKVKDIVVKPWEIFFAEPMLILIHMYTAVSRLLLCTKDECRTGTDEWFDSSNMEFCICVSNRTLSCSATRKGGPQV